MKIYNYHPNTGEYLSQNKADLNPMQPDNWLIPAYSTADVPPETGENEAAVFSDGVWSTVPDYRGTEYWVAYGEDVQQITKLGETVPEGAFLAEPEKPFEIKQEDKRNEIRSAFKGESEAPVLYNGISWHGGYDSGIKLDAAKRLAGIAGQESVRFYDTKNVGHDFVLSEATAVVVAVSAAYQVAFSKKQALMVQIDNATTDNDLECIVW